MQPSYFTADDLFFFFFFLFYGPAEICARLFLSGNKRNQLETLTHSILTQAFSFGILT